MKIMQTLWVAVFALVLCALPAKADVEVNQPAPDFTLTDSKGQEHALSDYKGKFVVLEWVNYECPFVIKHYGSGNMQKLQKDLTSQDVVWLSINSSAEGKQGYFSADEINQMMTQKNVSSSAYLLDTDGAVGKMYGAKTTPHMYIINPEGVLVYQGAIDDKSGFDPQEIPTSHNYVMAAFDEAKAGNPVSVPVTKSYGCSVKY